MPYGQPQDADQLFYSDFIVQWAFTGAYTVLQTIIPTVAPPGVFVQHYGVGLFYIVVPQTYMGNLINVQDSGIASVAVFPTTNASASTGVDATGPYLLRHNPLADSLSSGQIAVVASAYSAPQTPADPGALFTATVMCQLKFPTILVNVS